MEKCRFQTIASLFRGAAWEQATALPPVISVQDAPKPPSHRVSLSPARLSHARRVPILVSGTGKREAVMAWRTGDFTDPVTHRRLAEHLEYLPPANRRYYQATPPSSAPVI
ncbi:MAG: 6-phosphogluconolactonase [Gammaproteobacteria bacterium]